MIEEAKRWVREAEAIVIAAGAGMGVDSGLPDFRGPEGFWAAYPPYRGMRFEELANPRWFRDDPELAWGFYGHRLQLYRDTTPHAGFTAMLAIGKPIAVFTSNVDGQFQKAGYGTVFECHGSIHFNQCCGLFPATTVAVDRVTMRAYPPFPTCPTCGKLARPAILMFGDAEWDSSRSDAQAARLQAFLRRYDPLVIECGAGTAVASVRNFSERFARMIRINVRESAVRPGHISLALGARDALLSLAAAVG